MAGVDWTAALDPDPLLRSLIGIGYPQRRAHLFAVACCRRLWDRLDPRARRIIELVELVVYDDRRDDVMRHVYELRSLELGATFRPTANSAGQAVARLYGRFYAPAGTVSTWNRAVDALSEIARVARRAVGKPGTERWEREAAVQATLLRDVFSHYGRGTTPLPEWRTSTVVGLAERMYATRDFSAMPVLADALQDAGCEDADILGHCRGDGPHVRGCWAIDLFLGLR